MSHPLCCYSLPSSAYRLCPGLTPITYDPFTLHSLTSSGIFGCGYENLSCAPKDRVMESTGCQPDISNESVWNWFIQNGLQLSHPWYIFQRHLCLLDSSILTKGFVCVTSFDFQTPPLVGGDREAKIDRMCSTHWYIRSTLHMQVHIGSYKNYTTVQFLTC